MQVKKSLIAEHNDLNIAEHQRWFEWALTHIAHCDSIVEKVAAFQITIPSWALGTGGTRFARFAGAGEPRTLLEKIDDVGLLHAISRSSGSISLHFPWDSIDDAPAVRTRAISLGLQFDAVNSNTFQDTNKKDSATNGIGFVFNNNFVLAFVAQSNTQQATQTPTSTDNKSNSGTSTTPPTKTLDELLGIAGSGGEKAAQAQQKERLEQGLQESSLQDLADAAMADMKLAQQLFDKDRDLGMGTQRVQAQALSRLDALIEAAVKFEKSPTGKSKPSKSKKDSSESGSSKKPGGDETKDEANAGNKDKSDTTKNADGTSKETAQRNNNSTPGDEINPPEFMDAQALGESEIDESRTEWGHLPKRIREIMSQSRRDRISALYQKATEAYYRRMAEERGP